MNNLALGPFVSGTMETEPQWFENPAISYSSDDLEEVEAVLKNFIVANGRYYGGGLKPAPEAEPDDGLFDIVTIGDIGFLEVVMNLRKFTKGTHLSHPKISHWRAKRVEASSDERVLIEMDGEVIGTLPASFEVLPMALRVKV